MCGIAGSFAVEENGAIINIEKVLDCISHRGPDGGGVHKIGPVALGHRRLSIIDTSAAANQPMHSDDKRYTLIFNGEIFNYCELAAAYLPGVRFHTTSDTEVLLKMFERKGPDCFALLRGFFALAIYDAQKNELFVARDRYGKKPLHYSFDGRLFLFASELRALMAFGIPKEIDSNALHYYFQFNYLPQPLSILKGVQKLPPGRYLKLSTSGIEEHQYYCLQIHRQQFNVYSYETAKQKLVQLMDEAVKCRLIADVPLGAFLSGGIDSSVVVGLAAKHKRHLNTFSIGYKDHPYYDETAYADLAAKKFGTNHTVFKLSNDDFLEHIDDVLDAIDEPFADPSLIPTFILSKRTRRQVTVALSGDGGDEVFAGYNKHRAEWLARQPSLKATIVKKLAPLWKVLPKSRNNRLLNIIRQLDRFAETAHLTPAERYWQWASTMPEEQLHILLGKHSVANANFKDQLLDSFSGGDFNEVLLTDMNMVLPSDMLVKVDMMSMANSLEIRSPFLDQEVVEFAFGLPVSYKIDRHMKKKIVQDAFRELLPPELYNRPKQGFDIPLLAWFRKELWQRIDQDWLQNDLIQQQGLFNPVAIQQLKRKLHSSNPENCYDTIWALIVFQHWWGRFIA